MKCKELIEKLKEYEEFDVEFVFSEKPKEGDCFRFLTIRVFENIDICDVGHSNKIVRLSGEESE